MGESKDKRILIIEDNTAFRKMLHIRLSANGYDTVVAKDGLEGLAAVRTSNPDLVITDIMLPGLDGHKICRMIKFDKKFKHIPVIVLTSRDLDEDEELAKRCGADAFIVKTTRAEIILDVIEKILARELPQST
ncbi:response regulator [candidate division KSB1 bacterium]|nr:response regulator [candidate division KSB1 bacterium]